MQINRLFQIVYILLDRKYITAKKLAEKLEVSPRTIYRDIDALSLAGIPIYTTKGKGGGIGLLDNFILNKSLLSEKDQKEILIGLQSLKATNYINEDETSLKLSRIFKKDNINWIEVDFSKWGANKDKEKFNVLKDAIINSKVVTFQYINYYGIKTFRKVEPLKLSFKDKGWYVQSYCQTKNEFRTFKITRISNLEETEEIFVREMPKDFKVDNLDREEPNMINVKLLFSHSVSYRVYDEFQEDTIEVLDSGIMVSLKCIPDDWLESYILSFGSYVKVLEPEFIKSRLLKEIKKTWNNYL